MIILTEKSSVAAAFADALDCQKKQGYYENDKYYIVYAIGHLLTLYMPEQYDVAFKKWRLEDLPIIPEIMLYSPIEKTKRQLDVIKKCFEQHKGDSLLLATDAEREGELIGATILHYVGFKNYQTAKRFWVSEALTKEVILTGIKNAKPLNDYQQYKIEGYARQHADWIIGINLTRLVTLECGTFLTVGRVQSAILGAMYIRDKQIAAFKKEKYYELQVVLQGENPFTVKLINPNDKDFPFRFALQRILPISKTH
jgi:DNA topoisomerase-3